MATPVSQYPAPPVRRLRVYSFDPQLSTQMDTAGFNTATIQLPWEPLEPGPVNEYFEVIDVDPVSGQFYDPVDLNDPHLLAQDGMAPSEGDPRFHQQMVFAVAMKTVRTFELALGRKVFWAPRWDEAEGTYVPVRKLRIYPHALREPNAYYSRDKKALLFGYFKAPTRIAGASWVFTALSHDIIVHETTHAILDGLHRRYAEPTSVDSLAFHEAFADIVALLSHFTLTEAVREEIARRGGSLGDAKLMSGLAKQFGQALGGAGALRDAIDAKVDGQPDHTRLDTLTEPHDRGAILVAAVFDAFLSIYQRRIGDLLRIADIDPEAKTRRNLHPDLVNRMTREAVKSAEHVMRMCIRALDYMPPVDIRFGEFLRAIVTADTDLIPDDRMGYRLAMIEAFRRRGILPEDCLSLAPDSLLWERPDATLTLENWPSEIDLKPQVDRETSMKVAEANRKEVHKWIMKEEGEKRDAEWQDACGIVFRAGLNKAAPGDAFGKDDRLTIWQVRDIMRRPTLGPKVEVHSVRTTRRAGPDGQDLRQLILEITQRRRGFADEKKQAAQDQMVDLPSPGALAKTEPPEEPDFIFRGGATLIFDLHDAAGGEGAKVMRYAIRKRIGSDQRLGQQRAFLKDRRAIAFGVTYTEGADEDEEPFAMVHRSR